MVKGKAILQGIQLLAIIGLITLHINSSIYGITETFSSEITPEKDYFSDLTLNPKNRIDILKAELYPEVYQKLTPQSTINTYKLPLSAPASTYVTQTYYGPYSHQTTRAIDFFGINLKVAASRSGVVMTKETGGKWNGWCNSYQDCYNKGGIWNGNHVLVRHNDGSYAYYIHMLAGSIRSGIEVGAPISQGQILGDVGATGYTCGDGNCSIPGAHLHFQTNLPNQGGTTPTPFEDCGISGNNCDAARIPLASRTYNSINYPPARANYNGRQSGIYYIGTDLAISAISITPNSALRLTREFSQPNALWNYNQETQRIEGSSNLCIQNNNEVYAKTADCNGGNAQKWIKSIDNQLQNIGTTKCLESDLSNQVGSYIEVRDCVSDNPRQYFRLSQEYLPIDITKDPINP
jgi:murein DD-endopeptidase MepM/ murein hydrolase activator NlpD